FAVFVCFPARALLGRIDMIMAVAGVMSVVFFYTSLFLWNYSIKRYTSAGG
ncbi:MAG: ABC-2 family transporter protein, partial [Spirochaetales bacterium]|nr:ABC-2 family transporter protein [Spirochaetales bacterium]